MTILCTPALSHHLVRQKKPFRSCHLLKALALVHEKREGKVQPFRLPIATQYLNIPSFWDNDSSQHTKPKPITHLFYQKERRNWSLERQKLRRRDVHLTIPRVHTSTGKNHFGFLLLLLVVVVFAAVSRWCQWSLRCPLGNCVLCATVSTILLNTTLSVVGTSWYQFSCYDWVVHS